jgi:hypothetical protein
VGWVKRITRSGKESRELKENDRGERRYDGEKNLSI